MLTKVTLENHLLRQNEAQCEMNRHTSLPNRLSPFLQDGYLDLSKERAVTLPRGQEVNRYNLADQMEMLSSSQSSLQLLESAMRENQELKKTIAQLEQTKAHSLNKQVPLETDGSEPETDSTALDELRKKIKRQSIAELHLLQQALHPGNRSHGPTLVSPYSNVPMDESRLTKGSYHRSKSRAPKRTSTQSMHQELAREWPSSGIYHQPNRCRLLKFQWLENTVRVKGCELDN